MLKICPGFVTRPYAGLRTWLQLRAEPRVAPSTVYEKTLHKNDTKRKFALSR